jgi:hypothetical protein
LAAPLLLRLGVAVQSDRFLDDVERRVRRRFLGRCLLGFYEYAAAD